MDYDTYLERQVEKYQRSHEVVSNCCGAEVYEETDICCKCQEHCEALSIDDYEYEQKERAYEDRQSK